MLGLLKKETHTPQTEHIYKVPLCIQDTIPNAQRNFVDMFSLWCAFRIPSRFTGLRKMVSLNWKTP